VAHVGSAAAEENPAGGVATRAWPTGATHELEDGRQGIGLLELEDGLPGSMKMEKKVRARVRGRLGHSYHVRP